MNIYFLPYSVACIWAYVKSQPALADVYHLDQIVWRRDPIDQLAQQLSSNHMVMFSTYIWNRNYNYTLARKIKQLNPQVITVFGGPEPKYDDQDFFQKHPYIDFVIKREGELVSAALLTALHQHTDPQQIPGLIMNCNGQRMDTGEAERITDLDHMPSPYLTGVFDQLLTRHPDISWNASLETNRGCPYQCTFCDWGSLTYSKVKQFPLDRVFEEIDWLGPRVTGIYCADANFGMFIDRDAKIVDKIIEINQQYPCMSYIYFNWAKNQKNDVIGLVKRLTEQTGLLNNGLTVSTQSMTPAVLDNIKRTNLKQHRIQEIYDLARVHGVMTYTELILGLPGETKQSFQDSVFAIMESDLHHGVEINQSQLLSNAELNTVQRDIYDIKTVEMLDYVAAHQSPEESEILETVATTISTSSMGFDDMVDTNVWLSFMMLMHFYGFSTQIARFARRYGDISYCDFYSDLYKFAIGDQFLSSCRDRTHQQVTDWHTHGYLPRPLTREIPFSGCNILSSFNLLVQTENQIDHTFDVVAQFVDQQFDWPQDLKQQLFEYQKAITYTFQKQAFAQKFDYDFAGYIERGSELLMPCEIEFSPREIHQNLKFNQYLENIYYKRRQQFGVMSIAHTK